MKKNIVVYVVSLHIHKTINRPLLLYTLQTLPKNARARRNFLTNGHLKMIQNLKPDIDSDLFKVIQAINCCFPEDVLQ